MSTPPPSAQSTSQQTGCYDRGDGLDYVRYMYGVDVEQGQRVTVDGRPGTVTWDPLLGAHYVHVQFDGEEFARPCHPTWRVDYSPARGQIGEEPQHG